MTEFIAKIRNVDGEQVLEIPHPHRFPSSVTQVRVVNQGEHISVQSIISKQDAWSFVGTTPDHLDRDQPPPQEREVLFEIINTETNEDHG